MGPTSLETRRLWTWISSAPTELPYSLGCQGSKQGLSPWHSLAVLGRARERCNYCMVPASSPKYKSIKGGSTGVANFIGPHSSVFNSNLTGKLKQKSKCFCKKSVDELFCQDNNFICQSSNLRNTRAGQVDVRWRCHLPTHHVSA